MPATFSDYLLAGGVANRYVRLVSNSTGLEFISASASAAPTGLWNIPNLPGDTYTVYLGPPSGALGPWGSPIDTAFVVGYAAGDNAALLSLNVASSGAHTLYARPGEVRAEKFGSIPSQATEYAGANPALYLTQIDQELATTDDQHDLIILCGASFDIHMARKAARTVAHTTAGGVATQVVPVDTTQLLRNDNNINVGATTGVVIGSVDSPTQITLTTPISFNNNDAVVSNPTGVLFMDLDIKVQDWGTRPIWKIMDGSNSSLIGFPAAGRLITLYGKFTGGNGANSDFVIQNSGASAVVAVTNSSGVSIGSFTDAGNFTLPLGRAYLGNTPTAADTTSTIPAIYATSAGGGAYPFLTAGNLVLQSRPAGQPRDIVFITGNSQTVQAAITSAGDLQMFQAVSRIIPGVTSWAVRNNANSADNISTTDVGLVSVRGGLITQTGNLRATAGNLTFGAASPKIVGGATALLLRNNADTQTNLGITDAGNVTTFGTLQIGSRPAFVASDKYLVVDSSGNVHVSALGPAS